jgi:hypothetical protein
VQPHDLVAFRFVAGDRVAPVGDQLLDQLGARGLVLDQHDIGIEVAVLVTHRTLQCRIFEALAQHVEQKEILAPDAPGRADAEVAELGHLVGGIPTLHDAVEALWPLVRAVAPEPFGLDHAAAQGRRGLLILAGEVVFADRPADTLEGVASGSRSGCSASPGRRAKDRGPQIVSIWCTSSASAIAGKRRISHGSCASTWPTRSSSCSAA